jgi:hypothetical protein
MHRHRGGRLIPGCGKASLLPALGMAAAAAIGYAVGKTSKSPSKAAPKAVSKKKTASSK